MAKTFQVEVKAAIGVYEVLPEDVECEDSNLQAVAEGETILHIETWNGVKKDGD